MMPTADHLKLFDIPAAVEYLKSIGATAVTDWTVRSLITSGQLPRIPDMGRRIYVTKAALDAWLVAHERRAK